MQCAIDNAKRRSDIDLVKEIKRIKNDLDISENKFPIFWKYIKDNIKEENINKGLLCPMNYLCEFKFKEYKPSTETLPMSYFFQKFELEKDRRTCKKVEELIEKYSFQLYNTKNTDLENDDYLLLRSDFDKMIEDIRMVYMSKSYIGLMSWLVDRAFHITKQNKQNRKAINSKLDSNKSILLKTLFDINSQNLLKIFSKNA